MRKKILAIDDDKDNLAIIEMYLEDLPYEILTTTSPKEGLEILDDQKIHTVLLDRRMPEMNGLAFVTQARMKHKHVPVIMQSAASTKQDIEEGINAGVFYYLTKPYTAGLLKAVLNAALLEYDAHQQLLEAKDESRKVALTIRECSFYIHNFDEAYTAIAFISQFFPNPDKAMIGVSEMVVNAIEHGSLGITGEEKSELLRNGNYSFEVDRRSKLPPYAKRKVTAQVIRTRTRVLLTVEDEGEGFDPTPYLSFDTKNVTGYHGRGIALSRMVSFDDIRYEKEGRKVFCLCDIKQSQSNNRPLKLKSA